MKKKFNDLSSALSNLLNANYQHLLHLLLVLSQKKEEKSKLIRSCYASERSSLLIKRYTNDNALIEGIKEKNKNNKRRERN